MQGQQRLVVNKHRPQRQKPTEPPHEHLTMLTPRKQTLTSHSRILRITTKTAFADPIRNVNRDSGSVSASNPSVEVEQSGAMKRPSEQEQSSLAHEANQI